MNSREILIIRLSSLGDLVLATSAMKVFQESGAKVSLLTKAEFAPLFEGQPGIKEVLVFDKRLGEKEARSRLFSELEARRFDLIVDLQNSWRTWSWRSELRRMAKVEVLSKPRIQEWMILWLRLGFMGFGRGGRARRFRDFAVSISMGEREDDSPLTALSVSAEEKEAVSGLLPQGDYVVVLPGGAWKTKEWPYFSDLARLIAREFPVVVLGGAKDWICESVAEAAREIHPESRTLHGKTSLKESMAVIASAKWVVGNDTGMVHVAEALGKPVAMIEGPTHPDMGFSPYRKESLAIGLPLFCRPCSKSGRFCYRLGSRACLKDLSAEFVAEQMRRGGFRC